jgi:hypothetical protein
MARQAFPAFTGNLFEHTVSFSFKPRGSSAPLVDGFNAQGPFKVVRTGTGAFTVTLDDNYSNLVGFSASVGNNLANNIRHGVFTAAPVGGGPSTLTITSFADGTTAAAAADIAANDANIVRLTLRLAL